jgi:transposase
MNNANGVSRGDRNRNARLSRLRELVPTANAIVGIDLADKKQMVVVTDHDSKVLARRTFRCRAWDLGVALDWAAERAARAGFAGATVACEPTGHRWRVLGQLAADRGLSFVCVQTLMTSWARRSEDLTFDKTDLLTELPGPDSRVGVRLPVGIATFPAHGQRRGWVAGVVRVGGASGRVARGDRGPV